MKEKSFFLEVRGNGNLTIQMEKESVSIKEIEVIANKHDHIKGIQMGFERHSAKSMKEIPVVMGEKDILKVAQMLPLIFQHVRETKKNFMPKEESAL